MKSSYSITRNKALRTSGFISGNILPLNLVEIEKNAAYLRISTRISLSSTFLNANEWRTAVPLESRHVLLSNWMVEIAYQLEQLMDNNRKDWIYSKRLSEIEICKKISITHLDLNETNSSDVFTDFFKSNLDDPEILRFYIGISKKWLQDIITEVIDTKIHH